MLFRVLLTALLVVVFVFSNLPRPGAVQSAGGYSLRFYGHGVNDIDRVKIKIDAPEVPADIGATDFTIEFWMKASMTGNNGYASCNQNDGWITANIILDRDIYNAGDYGDFGIAMANGKIVFGVSNANGGTTLCGSANVADSVWHHIAVTRNVTSGSLRIYVDGVLDAQATGPTGNLSYRNNRSGYPDDPYLVIGAEKHDVGGSYPSYRGLFDELRLSKVIRYSSTFTRPTTAFATDGNTVGLYHFDAGPAGACNGPVVDSSGAAGGPSNGTCNYGGSDPSGPVYETDNPFASGSNTPVPTFTQTPIPASFNKKIYLPIAIDTFVTLSIAAVPVTEPVAAQAAYPEPAPVTEPVAAQGIYPEPAPITAVENAPATSVAPAPAPEKGIPVIAYVAIAGIGFVIAAVLIVRRKHPISMIKML